MRFPTRAVTVVAVAALRATATLPPTAAQPATDRLPATLHAASRLFGEAVEEKSADNLTQMGIAVANYATKHKGNLLPAALLGKAAKPLLSWRVLILPELKDVADRNLFKEFRLNEAWDSDHNKTLLARMPKVYAIPGTTRPGGTDTHYRVFVGNGAGWELAGGLTYPASFPDGTSNTIMFVTAAEAVPWTKPDELEFDPKQDMRKHLGRVVNGKVQVATFDGSARFLNMKILKQKTFNNAITPNDGNSLSPDF